MPAANVSAASPTYVRPGQPIQAAIDSVPAGALAPWREIAPWGWALGGDPLVNGAEIWRYLLLGGPAVLLAFVGALAFERRDIRSA